MHLEPMHKGLRLQQFPPTGPEHCEVIYSIHSIHDLSIFGCLVACIYILWSVLSWDGYGFIYVWENFASYT